MKPSWSLTLIWQSFSPSVIPFSFIIKLYTFH
jgi:hypothetical protein